MTESSPPGVRRIAPLRQRRREPFVARIPGSKSYTCRALLLAAMRQGVTEVAGGLDCDDTRRLGAALGAFGGLSVAAEADGFRVVRAAGRLAAPQRELDLGDAGAPARFLLAFAAAADGATVITGSPRLCARPMGDLLAALRALGIRCDCLGAPDHLPVRVHGGAPSRRRWRVEGGVSSQFGSALLLYASQIHGPPIEIEIAGARTSRPYVAMTLASMRQCGIAAEWRGEHRIVVHPSAPACARIAVEIDASSMSYFLAMAAVTGTTVEVPGIGAGSAQGDIGFLHALSRMGCTVEWQPQRVRATGAPLRGIDADLADMPDVALTLAAVAACAEGPTRLGGLASLRVKESDRIEAAAAALRRLGARVEVGPAQLAIHPARVLEPARVRTGGDHRVAMAFAVLGLLRDGIEIEDPDCVGKSFPGYWREFDRFRAHHERE